MKICNNCTEKCECVTTKSSKEDRKQKAKKAVDAILNSRVKENAEIAQSWSKAQIEDWPE